MQKIKDQFTFKTNGVIVRVEKINNKFFAIGAKKKVELNIELCGPESIHKGKISRAEDNKYLGWLPSDALEDVDPKKVLEQIRDLLKQVGL
jgi:hypothetical protein